MTQPISDLSFSLFREFNANAALKPILVGTGVGKDAEGEFITVYLNEKPTAAQKDLLPDTRENIRLKYEFSDKFFALSK